MSIQHADIADADRHEPKGISTAASGAIYVADGTGSGSWQTRTRYGELYIDSGVTAQALAAASAYARLDPGTEWTSGENYGFTLTPADGTFTILEAGTYHMYFWITFTTAALAVNTLYNFRYAVNGVTPARTVTVAKQTAGVDTLSVSAAGLATLAANDVLSIYVGGDGTSSGTNITPLNAGFSLHKV